MKADFTVSPAVLQRLYCFATPAVTPDGGSGASPAPAEVSPSPGAGAPTGTSPTPASNPNEANLRELREGYERYKQLGKPDELQPMVQGYRAMSEKAQELGKQLGYTPESLTAAFQKDPYAVIQRLQAELGAQPNNADTEQPPDLEQLLDERLSPIEQHFKTERAKAANGKFEAQFNELFSNHPEFKGASDVPAELKQVIFDMTSQSLKYDEKALANLLDGKTSDVQKYFDGVMERFLKVQNGYSQWKTARPGTQQQQPGQPTTKPKLSLQDIIDGNSKAEGAMPSLRRLA